VYYCTFFPINVSCCILTTCYFPLHLFLGFTVIWSSSSSSYFVSRRMEATSHEFELGDLHLCTRMTECLSNRVRLIVHLQLCDMVTFYCTVYLFSPAAASGQHIAHSRSMHLRHKLSAIDQTMPLSPSETQIGAFPKKRTAPPFAKTQVTQQK
jgi:hypothetical protein